MTEVIGKETLRQIIIPVKSRRNTYDFSSLI